MKKIYFLLFTLTSMLSFAQGNETFDGFSVDGNSYADGTFTGQDGSTWNYTQCRGDYEITGQSIMIGRNRSPQAEFSSGLISGGVGTISFNYMQAFGTAVNLNVLVNGVVVGNVTSSDEQDVIKASGTITVNTPGDVTIKFINAENGAGQVAVDDIVWTGFAGTAPPSISISSPSDNTTFAPGMSSVDVEFITANLAGSETVTVTVNGTPNTNATSPFTIATTDGETYDVTVDLIDGGSSVDSDMITFSVASINQVSNITELRAGTLGGTYELTGEAIISYIVTDGSRNQKYIQDGGAGILIDDSAGLLSTPFNIGDGITGLRGQLSEFANTLQFVPTQNVASASSTGNTLTPIVVSVSDLLNDGENYESRLITVNSATFADAGTFADNTNYDISNGADTTICRVAFGDEDLIGTAIPTTAVSITGLGGQFDEDYQIFPRYTTDIAAPLSVTDFNTNAFSLYPNPTNTGSVSISSTSSDAISVQVFDILGKQVKNQTVTNNTLNVSNLKSGVYIVKINQNNTSTTKKLVIK
ncbi:T9SS type A sorting domain-containing protein [Winogradskyella sp. F6397]|uniref:T9SS type A sorting domain-containing protein n=1 Tax=Winogradskyella marina TaxID=2785530 RepID=A0ABS0EGZ6_9FLAO|nr:T9SS type A sorting domain-containing protein [Winogradskyella marina]MBF8148812.1 T9SS type A sorting domain-containing protein [Winogradskyella marina]